MGTKLFPLIIISAIWMAQPAIAEPPAPVIKAVKIIKAKIIQPKKIIISPVTPGTSIKDPSKPGMKIEIRADGTAMIWPTTPGTTIKDPTLPTYKAVKDANGNTIVYSTTPGTSIRDFNAPSYKIEIKK